MPQNTDIRRMAKLLFFADDLALVEKDTEEIQQMVNGLTMLLD